MDLQKEPAININPDIQAIGAKPIDPLKAKGWTTKEVPYMYVQSWRGLAKELDVNARDVSKWAKPDILTNGRAIDKNISLGDINLPPAIAHFFKGSQDLKLSYYEGWFGLSGVQSEGKNIVKKNISLLFDRDGKLIDSRIEEKDRAENGDLAQRSVVLSTPNMKDIFRELRFGSGNTYGLDSHALENYFHKLEVSVDSPIAKIIDSCEIFHQTGNTEELVSAIDGLTLKKLKLNEKTDPVPEPGREWQVITRYTRIRPGSDYSCTNSESMIYTTDEQNSPANFITVDKWIPITGIAKETDELLGRDVFEHHKKNEKFKGSSSMALSCMPIDVGLMKLSPMYPS